VDSGEEAARPEALWPPTDQPGPDEVPWSASRPDAARECPPRAADSAEPAAVEHFRRAAAVVLALGTDIINTVAPYPGDIVVPPLTTRPLAQIWTAEVPAGLDWAANWGHYVEVTQRLCAICTDLGLRHALESHPYRWVCGAVSLLRLMDHVGSPALGVNLAPSHLFPTGDLPRVAAYQLAGRVWHTHLSDNDGTTNAHWRPGKGKIDWGALLQALQETGYQGTLSIE
jgi:sugar phosphate isomerase/epimerase